MASGSGKAVIGKSFQKKQAVQSKITKGIKCYQRKSTNEVQSGSEKVYTYVQ